MDMINNDIGAAQVQQMNQVASANGFQQELPGTERVTL
jgi:glucose-1-phosphate thymidylyltransferase